MAHRARRPIGRVGLHPLVTAIPILHLLEYGLLVDHRANAGRQAVQFESGAEILGNGELRQLVGRVEQNFDIVPGPAELREDESRRLFEENHPLQREGNVLDRHRIARMELQLRPDHESDRICRR